MAAMSTLLLASCGSYQYAGNSNDGIYGESGNDQILASESEIEYGTREENGDYYKRMFEEEAALYGEVLAEGAIFTDVDAYSSTGNYDYDNQNTNYQGGNAPWGNDPDSYAINIYDNSFYGGFFPYGGIGYLGFDPFWGPGNFYGPYGSGFYSPYGYGFGPGFGYGPGFGFGPGFGYGPGFGFGHGYGYGIGFSVHPFIYGSSYYNHNPYNYYSSRHPNFRQNVAFSSGRRGSTNYNANRNTNIRNASSLDNRGRSSSYSRSIRNIRNSNDEYGITRRSTSARTYNTRSNSDGSYSRSRSSSVNSNARRSNGSYSRSSSNTRSSSPTVRSSSNTGRSSSAGRSSSSSSSSRSSSSNRGRGN